MEDKKRGTFLQVPPNLDDDKILRRVLSAIIERIDKLGGSRGGEEVATKSQLNSTASSVEDINQTLNSLDNSFLRKDGKNTAIAPISYDSKQSLKGLNLIDYNTAKELIGSLPISDKSKEDLLKEIESKYVEDKIYATITKLSGDTDATHISAKVDEIIDALILVGLVST